MRRKLIALMVPPIAVLAGFAGLAPASAAGACQDGVNPANTRILVTNVQTKSFSDCTLSGISFPGSGGSIENDGTLTLTNVTISDSHSTGGSGSGGAIFNTGTLTLNNVTIVSSTAILDGGAIWNRGTVHVNGVTLGGSGSNGNVATQNGGGIYNEGVVDGTDLTILGNSAGSNGGGVYDLENIGDVASTAPRFISSGNFNVTTGSISNNTAQLDGGGAYVRAAGFNLSGFTISNNTATAFHGGGFYNCCAGSTATIDKSTIDGNHAHVNGGGFMVFGTLVLTNSSVQNNSAGTGDGGGILDHLDLLRLANDTISGNTAAGNGGGIAEECGGKLEGPLPIVFAARAIGTFPHTPAPNLTVSGNTATGNGGGVYVAKTLNCANLDTSQEVDLLNPTVADNKAASGGGLWVDGFSSINYANALLARNTPENCVDTGRGGGDLNDVGGANLDTGNTCQLDAGSDPSDQINVANPKLDVLADNFGPARTQALLLGSPAIDAVAASDCPPPPTDERGTTRPQAATCDIGAYECIGATPTVTQVQPNTGPPTGGTVVTITGTGFDRPATLTFGGTPGVGVTVNSGTQITATTPPGKGIETISIQTCRASSVSAFTFVTLPAAGRPAGGSGQGLPWAWVLLAMLVACPPLGLTLLGRRRRPQRKVKGWAR